MTLKDKAVFYILLLRFSFVKLIIIIIMNKMYGAV